MAWPAFERVLDLTRARQFQFLVRAPLSRRERSHVLPDPLQERAAIERAGGQVQQDAFSVVYRRRQLGAVEYQERLKRGVASTLVAIDKRMVPTEREPECSGLGREIGIEIFPTERHPRLGQCGLKGSEIANRR